MSRFGKPNLLLPALLFGLLGPASPPCAAESHQMEFLNRGLVAVRLDNDRVLLSWRLLGNEPADTRFIVYRGDRGSAPLPLHDIPLEGTTQYVDDGADLSVGCDYFIRAIHGTTGQPLGTSFTLPANPPERQYFRLPLDKPADVDDPTVGSYSYSANDCSVADLDGDGDYEMIVKWDPSNSKDNSQSGYTGNVYLDAYEFDGTFLWRIDLGINIRAGAHYTQFMAYDLDGDGIAEVACKTADGTTSGTGEVIGNRFADHRETSGYILSGPEFLTVFDGRDGSVLATTDYEVPRGDYRIWKEDGRGYGNRVDRFLACVAYLDGERPSLVMCRGYYTRSALVAYDWRDGQLTRRWTFDTTHDTTGPLAAYRGQGAHSLAVGDVDADGRDEIVYGACTIDDDGSGLYSTELGHGDATHLSDMDPTRPGLEFWMIHESPSAYGPYGSELHDAATGEIIFGVDGQGVDIGRGVAADIDPRYLGYETWASRGGLHNVDGTEITSSRPGSMNFLCWWDGDLLRELLDGTSISKWDWLDRSTDTLLSPSGISSNNSTKATPCLSADLFGDWREEVVWRESDSSALRIYTTTVPTTHRLPTLMHDRQYRLAIAWQNVAYNQPPHPGYYLGENMGEAPQPPISTPIPPLALSASSSTERFADYLSSRGLDPALDPDSDPDGNGMTLYAEYAFGQPDQAALLVRASGNDVTLDLASIRSELDYRIESSTDLSEWSPVITVSGIDGQRTSIEIPVSEPHEFYRAVAIGDYPAPVFTTTTIQAEDTSFDGSLESNHSGYHGTGFINFDTSGSFIEWSGIDGGIGGEATIRIRHAYGNSNTRTGALLINGVSQPVTFSGTGGWNIWADLELTVSLLPGTTNTIRLESNGEDLANIDELSVTVANAFPEAEPGISINTPVLVPHETGDIFVIGDSTVANYGSSAYPQRGWGQLLQSFVDPDRFIVTNRARGGRSSKSFIVEGLWDGVKAELTPGDFLLIQWGHNDRDFSRPERYTTTEEYRAYLAQYVTEARALGAVPVFVTPMVMNAWNGSTMRNVFTESGNDYAGSMKQVAAELDVPLIDLNARSHAFLSPLGYETAGRLFFHTYVAGEYPNYPDGITDGTHFQEMGALTMAGFVADGFEEIDGDPRTSALANGLRPRQPVTINANLPEAGTTSISTEFPEGVTFTLKAIPGDGHDFINWKDGSGQIHSTESLNTFSVGTEGHRFTAYFDNESPVLPPAAGTAIPGGDPFDYAIVLSADAYDENGAIVRVEYFNDNTGERIGVAETPPFSLRWEADSGSYRIRAESVNEHGGRLVSAVVDLDTEAPNNPPAAQLTSPATGSSHSAGDEVELTATASDPDGFVTKVVFYVDGTYLGEDSEAPYTALWSDIPGGEHVLSARAVDNRGIYSAPATASVSVDFGSTGSLLQEAESGTLVGSFTVVNDAAASGGQAVEAVSGPAESNYVEFQFEVPATGSYLLRARIKAVDGNHDSMFVSVDGALPEQYLWDTARSTGYVDDHVFHRGGPDPLVLELSAGSHTVRFGYRENLLIDQVELETAP